MTLQGKPYEHEQPNHKLPAIKQKSFRAALGMFSYEEIAEFRRQLAERSRRRRQRRQGY